MYDSNGLERLIVSATLLALFQLTLPNLVLAQSGVEQLNCEVAILRAKPEVAKRILADRNDSSVKVAIECVTKDTPTIKNNSVSTTTTTRYKETLPAYYLTKGEYQQILNLLKNSEGCSVSDSVKTKTSGNGMATGFDGTARTYCVASNKHRAKYGTEVSVPEYQVVEDGIIVEHQVKAGVNGSLDLNSQIVINEVTEVNTFTFDGATRPITLELAATSARKLNIKTSLPPNHVLIVPSPYIDNTIEQPTAKEPFLSNIPYVNRLFKNVGVGRDSCVLYYAISVKR